jgi:hypothetical protein
VLVKLRKECGSPFLECGELRPELFQLAIDARRLGASLLLPEVPFTELCLHEFLDLAAEQSQPRVPCIEPGRY